MKLSTQYLGLQIHSPLVVGASPFCDQPHLARQLQDAGAGAIVMRSLFEEQIEMELRSLSLQLDGTSDSSPEATSYFPSLDEYQLSGEQYLRQIEELKRTLSIPVIASLNGYRPGGWTDYARRFEAAGADAIELNLYRLGIGPDFSADEVEADMLETVSNVTKSVRIPVAVKLSPFHTSLTQFALSAEHFGAAGIVLFNRFYQPNFNIDELSVEPQLKLSDSTELLLRLRWLAILSSHVRGSLIATGGVHTSEDAVKAILAGAHAVQLVSVLLKHGPRVLVSLTNGIQRWMSEHDYTSVDELRGAMSLRRCSDPEAFERANYQRILQSWRV